MLVFHTVNTVILGETYLAFCIDEVGEFCPNSIYFVDISFHEGVLHSQHR